MSEDNCVGYMYLMFLLGFMMGFLPTAFQFANWYLSRRRHV